MCVDRARTIDFAQLAFHRGESETHFGGLLVGEDFEGTFVDGSGGWETVVGSSFCDVDCEELQV